MQIAIDRKIKGKGNFPIAFIVASEQVFAHWEVIKTNLMALSFQLILSSSKSTSRLEYLLALFGCLHVCYENKFPTHLSDMSFCCHYQHVS